MRRARPTLVPARVGDDGAAKEDAAVKSIRKLLWVLWGLGWVIVPLLLKQIGQTHLLPLVMFGSLAALFVVTWHKGAIIRALLRAALESRPRTEVAPVDAAPRQRIEVGHDQQVRVHTSELEPEELVGQTDMQRKDSARALQARS